MTDKQTVLITGGGSGIGKELVRLFANDGYDIVVFSLVQEELDQLREELGRSSDEGVHLYQADLSLPGAAQAVFDQCQANGHDIDILVNNAGFAMFGEHVDQDLEPQHNMMRLNIIAVSELARVFGAAMKARGAGRILNIGSTLGIAPVPHGALYGASKAFVNSLSVALAHELEPYGVTVSCMEPYATNTNFFVAAGEQSAGESEQSSDEIVEQIKAHDPKMVAQIAYAGLMAGKPIILPNFTFRRLSWLARALPTNYVARIMGNAFKSM